MVLISHYPHVHACARGKVIGLYVCFCCCWHKNRPSLGDPHVGTWATCKRTDLTESLNNWPQYASNCVAQATSVINSTLLPMPMDHTYLLDHVLSGHVHNWPTMIGNGRQQT